MNRRDFLATASLAGAATVLPATGAVDFSTLKKRVGLIGTGWYGKVDLLRLIQVAPIEVVGLCDVDGKILKEAGEIVAGRQRSGKTPRLFSDYREMLAKEEFDIVLVDTPDHWHALPAIAAIKAGAHVFVQKPTAVDVVESRAILDAARAHDRVVQVGLQRRTTPHLMEAKEKVIDAGLLGEIAHAEAFCYYGMGRHRKVESTEPPEHLDWEFWTGPAPMREFNPQIHPRGWRMYGEYGNGIMGDMGVHMLDAVRWMLDLNVPREIFSSGGVKVHHDASGNVADTQTAVFSFDDLDVVWTHRAYGVAPDPDFPWGFFIHGDGGTLKADLYKWRFEPAKGKGAVLGGEVVYELEEYPEDKEEKGLEKHTAPAVRNLMRDFLSCIESGEEPVSDIEEGHISSSSCMLANLAMKLGRPLKWDYEKNRILNDEEANKQLARKYRGEWVHP